MANSKHRDQTLLLIDSHALIHRAYHAFPPTLTNAKGQMTNAVYGFATLLMEVLIKFKPSHVVAVFDAPGDVVRHEMYHAYKANRNSPDEDLIVQIPSIEELLNRFNIPLIRMTGYEADDLIGTLDERHSGEWAQTIIVTGDRDLFQLVDEDTFVYLAGSSFSKSELFDSEGVKQKMGVGPEYIIDIKAIEGDASDNIPGVAGIGKKGAVDLVAAFGHLDQIYDRIEEVPNRYKNKLAENFEIAQLSRKLATIITDAPFDFDFERAPFGNYDLNEVKDFFQEMEFYSLHKKLEQIKPPTISEAAKQVATQQQSLFDADAVALDDWDGEKIEMEHVTIMANYNKELDPLTWETGKLLVRAGAKEFQVSGESISKFLGTLKVGWVITDDGKALLHLIHNRNLKQTFAVYDVVISTYLLSQGQIKQDLPSVLNWHKLGFADSDSERLEKMAEVYDIQKQQMEENPKWKKLVALEQKLIPIIVDMERVGITLDVESANLAHDKLSTRIDEVQAAIFKEIGHEFNIGSPKQVGEVLFEERGLPSGKKTKTGTYSTDERTLKELVDADPVVNQILEYRELTKLLSTYLKPLPQQVNKITQRIHTEFVQLGAVTGRFTSKYPNLQNIPLGEVAGVNIRSSFVAAPGTIFVAFDYSQQELRLLAELSGEENMQRAFSEGLDVHALTASEVFGVPIEEVTKKQRQWGKTINFGIVYGMSAFGFADRLKVGQGEALEFINKYFTEYPKVQKYFDQLIADATENGYVETIMGRQRNTLALKSPNYQMKKAAEREVMNFPLQGSAADIIKMAMVGISSIIDKFPAKMILQVHDELMFEYTTNKSEDDLVKDEEFRQFVMEVKTKMLDVVKLNVPLTVGVELGYNWGELQDADEDLI